MTTVAFKAEDALKNALGKVARMKGISLSALIKFYLTDALKAELSRITENNMTLAEELDILFTLEEGGDGKIYSNVESLISDLDDKH
jgi:hypothetical protein